MQASLGVQSGILFQILSDCPAGSSAIDYFPGPASLEKSLLSIVGHQYFSMCCTISSVPSSWPTNGFILGLYIESVRSRTARMQWMPRRVILADAEGAAQNAHVRVYAHENHILDPAFPQKAVNFIAIVGDAVFVGYGDGAPCCRVHALKNLTGFSSSHPPSESSMGSGGSFNLSNSGMETRLTSARRLAAAASS